MTVTARRYTSEPGFTDDFFAVREFLVRINADRVTTPGFLWGRWEWAFCLPPRGDDRLRRVQPALLRCDGLRAPRDRDVVGMTDAPHDMTDAPNDPERFFVHGRLENMPRRQADRGLVLRYVASRVLVLDEPVTGRFLTDRLAEIARDPVGLRRDLIESGLVSRTRDGAEYWRTHVTEFDGA